MDPRATGYLLQVELGDAVFNDPLRYFVSLKITGPNAEDFQERTDVMPTPSATPVFKNRSFSFSVPPDAEPGEWSLELSALAAQADASGDGGKAVSLLGVAVVALGGELLEEGEIERRVAFTPAPEDLSNPPDVPPEAAGSIQLTLRLTAELPPVVPPPALAAPPAPVVSKPRGRPAAAAAAAPRPTGAAGSSHNDCDCDAKEREVAHQQALIERLMADVEQRTAAVARAGEEVMELRGVNKKLETDLHALRAHVDERERAMEQLASDATNVENIDLPQLQSRHRMLGAAYRADRRRMEQLTNQVGQLTAALGTQEQLSTSYARLKEAHKEQAQQMQRLQEEAKKVAKYRQTAKQQEAIIQRLESLMAATLKDAKKLKVVEPLLAESRQKVAELEEELVGQREMYVALQEEGKKAREEMQRAMEEGRVEAPTVVQTGEDGEEQVVQSGHSSEEMVRLQMKLEKAERRASALEDELQEMARAHGKDVAALKMKLAEAHAQAAGGFGTAANLALGEFSPAFGVMGSAPAEANAGYGVGMPSPPMAAPPPLGGGSQRGSRGGSRAGSRNGARLAPLDVSAPAPAPAVVAS